LNNLIVDEQNGFRPKWSCEDHIFSLLTILKNRKSQNKNTFVAFVDAEKAFDRIDRQFLLYKLLKIGITGKTYKMIKTIYDSSLCCLNINGKLTKTFDSNLGVRQGDTLSPTLFNVFVNDLITEINDLGLGIPLNNGESISALLYADDIALIASSEQDLQRMLDTIYNWGEMVN